MKFCGLLLFSLISLNAFAFDWVLASLLDKKSSHIEGPNCWNAALRLSGVLPHLRQTLPNEWSYLLETQCLLKETPSSGDIGRIRDRDGNEIHGFIYIDEKRVFQKLGEEDEHPYQFVSFEEMLKQYGKSRQCRMSGSSDPLCFHKISYYDCSKKEVKTPRVHKNIREIEKRFEELLFSKETKWNFKDDCKKANFLKRNKLIDESTLLLKEILQKERTVEESLRLEGIFYQFSKIKQKTSLFKCRKERDLREKSYREFNAIRKLFN